MGDKLAAIALLAWRLDYGPPLFLLQRYSASIFPPVNEYPTSFRATMIHTWRHW